VSIVCGEELVCDRESDCGAEKYTKQQCPPSLKKPEIEEEPQHWQEVNDRPVMVFAAYEDLRPLAGGPAIRIIASGLQEQFQKIESLYCQLWFTDSDVAVAVGPDEYIRIYPSTLHPDMFVSHFVLCPLPKYSPSTPFAVSVSPEPCEESPRNLLKVLTGRTSSSDGNSFALCISPLYNSFSDWLMVIEWFELHKLLGADEITIYNLSASPKINRVLDYYAHNPEFPVNVVRWDFPTNVKSNVWCQRAAVNDCLYRMGQRHSHVAITDLDEILVPRIHSTWKDLIEAIDKPHRGAFLFQHAYFRRNRTSDEEPYLITQQSRWRTDEVTPPGKIRCKSMYRASKVLKIDLHFPYQMVVGAEEYILPPDTGFLHHYRKQPMETFQKYPERFRFIEDSFMQRFGPQLKEKVQKVRNRLDL
jgi:hypothetical protein